MDSSHHQQTFQASYRVMLVDRATGEEITRIANIVQDGEITRNQDTQVTETASLRMTGVANFGANLIRIYADLTYADGEQESIMLGTFLPDGPTRNVSGPYSETKLDCYGRLRELADDEFAFPVSLDAGTKPMDFIESTIRESGLEIAKHEPSDYKLGQTWTFGMSHEANGESKLAAINELLELMGWNSARTDTYGRIVLTKYQDPSARAPSWNFTEGTGARFLQEMDDEKDWFDTANQVRVIYANEDREIIGIAIDDDPRSEFSVQSRGRIISKTYSYSDVPDNMSAADLQRMADRKAKELLDTAQSVIHRVKFTHIYAPISIGDVIELEYPTGGVHGRFAIRTQTIKLEAGLPVDCEARAFTRGGIT